MDIVPTEAIPPGTKTEEPRRYGMMRWQEIFSPRQLMGHASSVEVFRELLVENQATDPLPDSMKAAFTYLSFTLDRLRDYNSLMAHWHVNREVMVNTFDRHDFAFKWSFAEMPLLLDRGGRDWAMEQTAKCIEELVNLARPAGAGTAPDLVAQANGTATWTPPPLTLTCKSGDSLDHIADASVDCVVMDPPYYDNVMYAELSDFFYVWLKRTAGYVYPDLFRRQLTDKDNEAVANPAKFKGEKSAKALAGRDVTVAKSPLLTSVI